MRDVIGKAVTFKTKIVVKPDGSEFCNIKSIDLDVTHTQKNAVRKPMGMMKNNVTREDIEELQRGFADEFDDEEEIVGEDFSESFDEDEDDDEEEIAGEDFSDFFEEEDE